jgi:putative flippase GtrA
MRRVADYFWNAHRDKMLYLLVGGWNTLFQWTTFSALYYLLGGFLFSSWILVITKVFASLNGFLCYRYIVFGSRDHPVKEFLRFQLVYLPLFLVNLVVLPLALAYTSLNAYVVQAMFAAFSVIVGFLGNKYFTFRKLTDEPAPPLPGDRRSSSAGASAGDSAMPRTERSAPWEAAPGEGAPVHGTPRP